MEVTCVSKSLPRGMGNTVILGRYRSLGAHFETDIFILMLNLTWAKVELVSDLGFSSVNMSHKLEIICSWHFFLDIQ